MEEKDFLEVVENLSEVTDELNKHLEAFLLQFPAHRRPLVITIQSIEDDRGIPRIAIKIDLPEVRRAVDEARVQGEQ